MRLLPRHSRSRSSRARPRAPTATPPATSCSPRTASCPTRPPVAGASSRPRSRTCSPTPTRAGYPMKVALIMSDARPRRLPAALQQPAGVRATCSRATWRRSTRTATPSRTSTCWWSCPAASGATTSATRVDEALDADRDPGRGRARTASPRRPSRPSHGWRPSTATPCPRRPRPTSSSQRAGRRRRRRWHLAARLRGARRAAVRRPYSSPAASPGVANSADTD